MVIAYTWATDNQKGFKHNCVLEVDGEKKPKVSIQYYNRTWEPYPYKTVVSKALEKYKINIKTEDVTIKRKVCI